MPQENEETSTDYDFRIFDLVLPKTLLVKVKAHREINWQAVMRNSVRKKLIDIGDPE